MGVGSILRLTGSKGNSLIDTSSGAPNNGSGGQVLVGQTGAPFAVILDGGSIRALGKLDQAQLSITAGFLIRSADRNNEILIGQGQEVGLDFEDVSSGTVTTKIEVVDASRVLSGACPAARASGQYSQLTKPVIGPYAPEPQPIAVPLTSLSDTPGVGTGLALTGTCR